MTKLNQIELIRWATAGSVLGLIVLGLAWEIWLAPIRPGGSLLALKVLPLCLPLAGILKNRMYTYRWVSMLVWIYFTEGAVRAWSDKPPSNYLAMIEVALCLVVFVACSLHVRVRFKKAQSDAGANADSNADSNAGADANTNTNTATGENTATNPSASAQVDKATTAATPAAKAPTGTAT